MLSKLNAFHTLLPETNCSIKCITDGVGTTISSNINCCAHMLTKFSIHLNYHFNNVIGVWNGSVLHYSHPYPCHLSLLLVNYNAVSIDTDRWCQQSPQTDYWHRFVCRPCTVHTLGLVLTVYSSVSFRMFLSVCGVTNLVFQQGSTYVSR